MASKNTDTIPIDGNIKANGFYIVESFESCWKCNKETPVYAFLLPEKHLTKEYEDEDDETNNKIIWKEENYKTILSYVTLLNDKSSKVMNKFTSKYFIDFSKQTGDSYFMNHCTNCNSKLGDFFMHSEPGGAFQPINYEEAGSMKLYWFNEIFEAHAGSYSLSVNYFDKMQIQDIPNNSRMLEREGK